MEKFGKVTPFGPKVISAQILNFKAIYEFLLLKIVGRPRSWWSVL